MRRRVDDVGDDVVSTGGVTVSVCVATVTRVIRVLARER